MNLLYFSHLGSNIFAGPNYSVPAGIKAQQEFDCCMWVNLARAFMPHWGQVLAYHNVDEYERGNFSMMSLPAPFNHPDLVVFEGFYSMNEVRISWELRHRHIPYIIVPRGSLTRQAMNNHSWLKKRVAHFLFFDGYCRHATAIQYLTEQEKKDSFKGWNRCSFVLPNGFDEPNNKKHTFSTDGIKMVFIGRPDKYHKGLDVLWQAISEIQSELRDSKVTLDFYGPKNVGDWPELNSHVEELGLHDIIFMHDQIGGREKEEALLDADLFVLTSRFEGHPMGLVEALAYGLPVLVTPGSNMAKEVHETNAGWVTQCDSASIKESILMVIKEKMFLKSKGENALLLSEKYRWRNIAKDFHEIIPRLL